MREILFRGFCPHENKKETVFVDGKLIDGAWVEGHFAVVQNMYTQDRSNDKFLICNGTSVFNYEVIPETIGQYTGLKDKNGKKVFEGDVVLITDDEGNMNFPDGGVGAVEFYDGSWYVNGCPNNGLYDLDKGYEIKVIGNIYDNPELLERKYE